MDTIILYFDKGGYRIYCSNNRTDHYLSCSSNRINVNQQAIVHFKNQGKIHELLPNECVRPYNKGDVNDEFLEVLSKFYDNCPKHDIMVVLGDMNAKVAQA